jgi:hypothetical protein
LVFDETGPRLPRTLVPKAGLVLYVRPLSVQVSSVTNLTFCVPTEPLVVARSWSFALTIVFPASADKSNFR